MTRKTHPSLKAMAEDKALDGVSKETTFSLDPDMVVIEPGFNLRRPGPALDAHLERMYNAMKRGVPMPPIDVIVRDGAVIVRRGHCRTITAQRLKREGIDYRLQAKHYRQGDATEQTYDMMGENMGEPFSPLEQGYGFLRLLNQGQTVAMIAERLHVHRSTVENGLAMVEMPGEAQKLVTEEKVSAHTALKTVRDKGQTKGVEALQKGVQAAEAAGKSKATSKHIDGPKVPPKPPKARRESDPVLSDAKVQRLVVLATKLAALNTLATFRHAEVAELVTEARMIVGV